MKAVAAFWREYARLMAEHQTAIWLWLVYFFLIGPTWLTMRLAGKSTFARVREGGKYWIERPQTPPTVADLRRMG